jgi:pimeloyl-ACP methyl ester carboxylesterase
MSALPATLKSTTVRILKGGVGLLSELAPVPVAETAALTFMRPAAPRRAPQFATKAPPRHFHLDIPGYRLAAWEWGSGPTVLLLHGWSGHAAQLASFVDPLVERGHHVVAVDLPAHGASEGPRRANVVLMSEAVANLAERFEGVRGVVAHSFGASATALALARRAPIEAAVLISPAIEVLPYADAFANTLGLGSRARSHFYARLEREVGRPLGDLHLDRAAPLLAAPTLIIHDRGDREVAFSSAEAIARRWLNATLLPCEGLGHYRILRDAQVTTAAADFLSRRAAQQSA